MGKSDLTFDFGVWGATSPPYTAPPLSKPHICNWQVHRSTQIQSLHLKMNTIVELLKKKRKKRKDFPECTLSTAHHRFCPGGPAFMKIFLSANQPELLPSQCVPTALYRYVYIYKNQVLTVLGFSQSLTLNYVRELSTNMYIASAWKWDEKIRKGKVHSHVFPAAKNTSRRPTS